MAGTVDMVTRVFAGGQVSGGALTFRPCLPAALRRVEFEVEHRGQRIEVTLDQVLLRLAAHPCAAADPVRVQVAGTELTLRGGQTVLVDPPGPGGRGASVAAPGALHHARGPGQGPSALKRGREAPRNSHARRHDTRTRKRRGGTT